MKARSLLLVAVAVVLPFVAACSDDSDDEATTTTEAVEQTTTEAPQETTTTEASTETTGVAPSGPTEAEVSAALQTAFQVDAATGDCAAFELRTAVSPDSWAALASGNRANIPAEEVAEVEEAIRAAFAACT